MEVKLLLSALILTILSFAVYSNTFGNQFLSDDLPTITNNKNIENLSEYGLTNLVNISLLVNHKIGGLDPTLYHVTNITLHTLTVLALFFLVRQIVNFNTGFITSIFFALHPAHTEAVTWISGRPYLLYSLFFILSLLFFIKSVKSEDLEKKWYILSLIAFSLSLYSVQRALVLPFVLLLYLFIFDNIRDRWKLTTTYFGVSFLYFISILGAIFSRYAEINAGNADLASYNLFTDLPYAITSYAKLLFIPLNLSFYHEDLSPPPIIYILGLGILLATVLIIPKLYRTSREMLFALGFLLITLLSSMLPIKFGWLVAERYIYLPALGFCLILALLIQKIKIKYLGWVIVIIVSGLYFARTYIRNFDFKDADTLWVATVNASPNSPKAHNNMGDYYARRGDNESSINEFKKAVELNPTYADAHHNLANVYIAKKEIENAAQHYQLAIRYNPTLVESYVNLAIIYYQSGHLSEAEKLAKQAERIRPNFVDVHNVLGAIYLSQGEKEKARQEFETAIKLDPNAAGPKENLRKLNEFK